MLKNDIIKLVSKILIYISSFVGILDFSSSNKPLCIFLCLLCVIAINLDINDYK